MLPETTTTPAAPAVRILNAANRIAAYIADLQAERDWGNVETYATLINSDLDRLNRMVNICTPNGRALLQAVGALRDAPPHLYDAARAEALDIAEALLREDAR